MYTSVRHYQSDPDTVRETVKRIRGNFESLISSQPGFIAYYVIDEGNGDLATISMFETSSQAEASNILAADWVGQNLSSFNLSPPQIIAGEVAVQRAKAGTFTGSM